MRRTGMACAATAALLLTVVIASLALPAGAVAAQARPLTASFGPEGTGPAPFGRPVTIGIDAGAGIIYVADSQSGAISKFDSAGTPTNFVSSGSPTLEGFTFNGSALSQIAVDPISHDFYVLDNGNGGRGSVRAFHISGEAAELTALGSSEIPGEPGDELCGVAVDAAGYIYVGDFNHGVAIYSPTGEAVTTVPAPGTCSVAVGADHALYAGEWNGTVRRLEPSEYPPTAATTYSVSGTIGGAPATSVYTDPTGGPVLVDEEHQVSEFSAAGVLTARFASSGPGAVTGSEGAVYGAGAARAYVADAGSKRVKVFGAPEFLKPEIAAESVSAVEPREAILEASINPNSVDSSAYFEYGAAPCSIGPCSRTETFSIGAGETSLDRTAGIAGLESGSTYFFRVVAQSASGTSVGEDRSFTTTLEAGAESDNCPNEAERVGAGILLPDCRAYEMVSPVDKEGNDVRPLPDVSGAPTAIDQSSSDGEALTFSTFGAFAAPSSAPYVSQYLAVRGADGWSTRNLTPVREGSDEKFANEFKQFTPDLSTAWLVHTRGPSLAAGGPSLGPTLYERATAAGSYVAVNTTADSTYRLEERFPLEFQGAGGGNTFFRVPVGEEGKYQVFESAGGVTRQVSVLPDGTSEPAKATVGGYGYTGEGGPTAELDHAVSADGSIVYWTGASPTSLSAGPIYVRVDGTETRPVSELISGDDAVYWLAARDGSAALFSFEDGPDKGDLYRYSLASGADERVCGELVGVVGGSEDLSLFYFVSLESIGGAGTAGTPNLYLDRGGRIQFVATLSSRDGTEQTKRIPTATNPVPFKHTASVSADGNVLIFDSLGEPTGYDNRDLRSGAPDDEVYRFDAADMSLDCISCNPTGARPEGRLLFPAEAGTSDFWSAAEVPAWQTPLMDPRTIAAGGDRIFFDSYAPLLPRDGNGKEDVYEWEAAGSGTCVVGAADYFARNGGCLSLISTGTDPLDSEFLDASPTGRDVFFSTGQSLVAKDDGFIDIYDARELGGFAEPPTPPGACEGAACQGAADSASAAVKPGSDRYVGPGNRHRKKRHRHKGQHRSKHRHRHDGRRKGHGQRTRSRDSEGGQSR